MKSAFIKPTFGTFLILLSTTAYALGGWSSGGGELLKDSRNPWFLNNVRDVSYCVLFDNANFGTTKENAESQISRALQFWKKQFAYAVLPRLKRFGQLQIASQNFHQVPCESDPDITFQFGVLTKEQKKYLSDPREYAAISARTQYDEASMRGKGFVYISPSHGPLSYNSEGVTKNAWSIDNGKLLYLTLLHEMGHIFGLPHLGSYGDLMSEGFVESILASATNENSSELASKNFFSLPEKSRRICQANETVLQRWHQYFGLGVNDKCLEFELVHDANNQLFGETQIEVFASTSPSSARRHLYSISTVMDRFFPSFISLIWLPDKQTVFEKDEALLPPARGVLGVNLFSLSKQGQFKLMDGKTTRSISVRFEQGKGLLVIDGVLDGQIVPIL